MTVALITTAREFKLQNELIIMRDLDMRRGIIFNMVRYKTRSCDENREKWIEPTSQ